MLYGQNADHIGPAKEYRQWKTEVKPAVPQTLSVPHAVTAMAKDCLRQCTGTDIEVWLLNRLKQRRRVATFT
jgi:hypothetical protein